MIELLVIAVLYYVFFRSKTAITVGLFMFLALTVGLGWMFWQCDSHIWFWSLVVGSVIAVIGGNAQYNRNNP